MEKKEGVDELTLHFILDNGSKATHLFNLNDLNPKPKDGRAFLENNDIYAQQIMEFLKNNKFNIWEIKPGYTQIPNPKPKVRTGELHCKIVAGSLNIQFLSKENEIKLFSFPFNDLNPVPQNFSEILNNSSTYLNRILEKLLPYHLDEGRKTKFVLVDDQTSLS